MKKPTRVYLKAGKFGTWPSLLTRSIWGQCWGVPLKKFESVRVTARIVNGTVNVPVLLQGDCATAECRKDSHSRWRDVSASARTRLARDANSGDANSSFPVATLRHVAGHTPT